MDKVNIEERVALAESLFKEGYNCSQSVVAAYSDYFNLDRDTALKISASFGGGIGRMRQTCGAACGMFLLTGLVCGSTDPKDNLAKGDNYAVVQQLAAKFKSANGSIICGELLGLVKRGTMVDGIGLPTTPQKRDGEYYTKRPCVESVKSAAQIFGEYINNL